MPRRRSRSRFVLEAIEGTLVGAAAFISWPASRLLLRNLGSTRAERDARWPGDELVSANLPTNTRAIDIAAPASAVWAWLVQFDLDRAGFYSYELFERLLGIPVINVESIEAQWQSLAVGDQVRLHPTEPGIPIALLEKPSHICFGERFEPGAERPPLIRSWSFYVVPSGANACRLLVRGCFEHTRKRTLKDRILFALEQPIDFIMEQRMLRTIRRLAQNHATDPDTVTVTGGSDAELSSSLRR